MAKGNIVKKKPLVLAAMSGGVDSSVSAALLKKEGYEVVGVFMRNWSEIVDSKVGCPWVIDQEDARKAAAVIGIPFYTLNFEQEYRAKVVDYFISEYRKGRTPNPDIACNKEIKFGLFLEKALKLGADFVATGHYVRKSEEPEGSYKLLRGVDPNKDQSYFLWTLTQSQLRHSLFPVGGLAKPKVREMAKEFGLPNYKKPDSQGICFMGEIDVWDFLKTKIPSQKGPIVTAGNKIIGEHEGLEFYTIGQRKHIGVGGSGPYYVADKDFENNTLIVVDNNHDRMLYKKVLMADEVSWVSGREPEFPASIEAQIRYRQAAEKAVIEKTGNNNYKIVFDEPQRAVTIGQSIVFYQGEEVLGGGVIEKVL